MKSDPLAQIIRRCQKGDHEAFGCLIKEFGPKLYRYFLRTSGSGSDAEDLLQDLFVKLFVKIKKDYRHEGKFEPWLFRVAANLVRDFHRSRQRSIKIVTPRQHESDRGGMPDEIDSQEFQPHQQAEQNEQLDRLQEALMTLPALDREIIMLRHYGGLSFSEIAEYFDIPMGTALAKVHRGLKKLQRMLTKNEKS